MDKFAFLGILAFVLLLLAFVLLFLPPAADLYGLSTQAVPTATTAN